MPRRPFCASSPLRNLATGDGWCVWLSPSVYQTPNPRLSWDQLNPPEKRAPPLAGCAAQPPVAGQSGPESCTLSSWPVMSPRCAAGPSSDGRTSPGASWAGGGAGQDRLAHLEQCAVQSKQDMHSIEKKLASLLVKADVQVEVLATMRTMQADIGALQADVGQVREQVAAQGTASKDAHLENESWLEKLDRAQRDRNVMLWVAPCGPDVSTAVRDLLPAYLHNSIQEVRRMGPPASNGRPTGIRVTFVSQAAKHGALRCQQHLRARGASVQPDMTLAQIAKKRALKPACNQLMARNLAPFWRDERLFFWKDGVRGGIRQEYTGGPLPAAVPSSQPPAAAGGSAAAAPQGTQGQRSYAAAAAAAPTRPAGRPAQAAPGPAGQQAAPAPPARPAHVAPAAAEAPVVLQPPAAQPRAHRAPAPPAPSRNAAAAVPPSGVPGRGSTQERARGRPRKSTAQKAPTKQGLAGKARAAPPPAEPAAAASARAAAEPPPVAESAAAAAPARAAAEPPPAAEPAAVASARVAAEPPPAAEPAAAAPTRDATGAPPAAEPVAAAPARAAATSPLAYAVPSTAPSGAQRPNPVLQPPSGLAALVPPATPATASPRNVSTHVSPTISPVEPSRAREGRTRQPSKRLGSPRPVGAPNSSGPPGIGGRSPPRKRSRQSASQPPSAPDEEMEPELGAAGPGSAPQ